MDPVVDPTMPVYHEYGKTPTVQRQKRHSGHTGVTIDSFKELSDDKRHRLNALNLFLKHHINILAMVVTSGSKCTAVCIQAP